MKLDRNVNASGRGKYALVKLRNVGQLDDYHFPGRLFKALERINMLDWGDKPETEFFVIRLKDKYAQAALHAYAIAAREEDPEYADEIEALAARAGSSSPFCKRPD
jgi:hypothetical protein